MAPKDLKRVFPTTQFGGINEIVPITMGQSDAKVYSATTETGTYVLRICSEDDGSWKNAVLMQEIASQHSIAPMLVYINHVERATVSVKVSGVPFGTAIAQPATRPMALRSLIEVLTKLHATPVTPSVPANPIDFAHSVWDGHRVWLVDWERAGAAHPYLDLVTICIFLILPDELALELLERQEQTPIKGSQKLLFAALRDLYRVAYGSVFLCLVNDLRSVEFVSREDTLTLGECFAMLSTGKLELSESRGRALIAVALLKQCEIALPPAAIGRMTL
jgi:hypothetical protein